MRAGRSCSLSADDWLLPLHLERLHDVFARNPQLDIVYSNAYIADALERVYAMRRQAFPIDYVDDHRRIDRDAHDDVPALLADGALPP